MFLAGGKKHFAWLLGFMLVLVTLASPRLSAAQTLTERVKDTGVLRVGVEGAYPPYNYFNDHGDLAGFDIDLSKEIARRFNAKPEFIIRSWEDIIQGLEDDEYDVIIAQMSVTEQRQQIVDFTDPYLIGGGVLVARVDDNRFSQLADIAGHIVGVGKDTTFEALARSIDGADVRTFDDFEAYSRQLTAGLIDVFIDDQLTAAYAIKEQGLPLKITSSVFSDELIAIAVNKNHVDFVDDLNRILREMKDDGTYRTIFESWFGAEPLL